MVVNEEAWRVLYEKAACARRTDVDFFDYDEWREAVRVCWTCPVSFECNQMAVKNQERFGVWGGVPRHGTSRTRRKYLQVMESVWEAKANKKSGVGMEQAAEAVLDSYRGRRP